MAPSDVPTGYGLIYDLPAIDNVDVLRRRLFYTIDNKGACLGS